MRDEKAKPSNRRIIFGGVIREEKTREMTCHVSLGTLKKYCITVSSGTVLYSTVDIPKRHFIRIVAISKC